MKNSKVIAHFQIKRNFLIPDLILSNKAMAIITKHSKVKVIKN